MQAFFQNVVLFDQPFCDVGIGYRAFKQRLVVGKPDVAVHGTRHFQQALVEQRDGALVGVRLFL